MVQKAKCAQARCEVVGHFSTLTTTNTQQNQTDWNKFDEFVTALFSIYFLPLESGLDLCQTSKHRPSQCPSAEGKNAAYLTHIEHRMRRAWSSTLSLILRGTTTIWSTSHCCRCWTAHIWDRHESGRASYICSDGAAQTLAAHKHKPFQAL